MKINNIKLLGAAFTIVLTLVCTVSFAQMSNSEFKKKFTDADFDMQYDNYDAALKKWLELYAADNSNANVNYKLGYCYLKSASEKLKSIPLLELASKNTSDAWEEFDATEKKAPTSAIKHLAAAYHLDGRIDEAITAYGNYRATVKVNKKEEYKEIDRQIEMCNNAKEFMQFPVNIVVQNLGEKINSSASDFSPAISADESTLTFTSRRENPEHPGVDESGQFYEDIYVSYKQDDETWSEAKPIGSNVNTNNHDAVVNLTADGQQLFIYRGESAKGGDVYTSELNGDVWSVPQKLGSNINSKYWETHCALTADNRTLYFVSDRPGGLGGRDIYRCTKLPNGEWSLAMNVGPTINTEYDEDGIFLHPDGSHVYFASKGHKSMGGFDIFLTEIKEDGTFATPSNIGYPINSTDDDVFFVVSTDGRRAYYSSAKEIATNEKDKVFGEKDIYVLNLVDRDLANVTILKGVIRPGTDTDILGKTVVSLADANSGDPIEVETRVNTKTGKFLIIMPPGRNYKVTYELGKYGTFSDTVMVAKKSAYREIDQEIDLTQPDPMHPKAKNAKVNASNLVAVEDIYYTSPETALDLNPTANDEIKKGKLEAINLVTNPTNGKAILNSVTNTIKYTPNKGFTGKDVFKYSFKNNEGAVSNETDITVVVNSILAANDKAKTAMNKTVEIKVLANDKVKNGKIANETVAVVKAPTNGDVTVDAKTGAISYAPNLDFTGEDNFVYTVKDEKGLASNEATVNVTVGEGKKANLPIATIESDKLNAGNCADKTANYEQFFTYNKNNISIKQKEFNDFIEALLPCIKANKRIELNIVSSASYVPTKTFKTNDKLAAKRASEAKESIIKALASKGVKKSYIKFVKIESVVNGPVYNNDFIENKSTFEKYQFTRITCN
jgi:tetratricopeptide (TPR) repeat protein